MGKNNGTKLQQDIDEAEQATLKQGNDLIRKLIKHQPDLDILSKDVDALLAYKTFDKTKPKSSTWTSLFSCLPCCGPREDKSEQPTNKYRPINT